MMSALLNQYNSEVASQIAKLPKIHNYVFEPHDLILLPKPVKKYFQHCGYIGKRKMDFVKIEWEKTCLKFSHHSRWKEVECRQYNAVEEPTRIVYMKSRLWGFLPFEGEDIYKDGHGCMQIRLLNIIPITNAKGREMDASELVTLLAECLLIPSYALQPYIHWQYESEHTAKATLTYNGTRVSGEFYFNAAGLLERFETKDRYFSVKGKAYQNIPWSVLFKNYRLSNGVLQPKRCMALWHTPDGNFLYFKGWIGNIVCNE